MRELGLSILFAVEVLLGQPAVGLGSRALGIVQHDGNAVAGRFGEPYIARNRMIEQFGAEKFLDFLLDLAGDERPGIVHGQHDAVDSQTGIAVLLHQANGIDQLGKPLERIKFALNGNDDAVRRDERVDRQKAQRRGTVDRDIVVFVLDPVNTGDELSVHPVENNTI